MSGLHLSLVRSFRVFIPNAVSYGRGMVLKRESKLHTKAPTTLNYRTLGLRGGLLSRLLDLLDQLLWPSRLFQDVNSRIIFSARADFVSNALQ